MGIFAQDMSDRMSMFMPPTRSISEESLIEK